MLTAFMRFMSLLGSGTFYVPVIALVFWCVSPRAGARATVVLSLNGMVNVLLKTALHLPRPYWTDAKIKPYKSLTSFGMPSGHAQDSVVAWGLLALEVRRKAVWAGAFAMMILIGVSRVYLGVHSVDQVFAGWAVGAVVLAVAVVAEPYVVPRWLRLSILLQVLLSLLVALLLLGLQALAVRHLHGFHYPPNWVRNIERSGGRVTKASLSEGAASAGVLFGGLAGISLLAWRGWFEPGGVQVWRRLARVPLGLAGAGVIYGAGLAAGGAWPVAFGVQAALGLWAAAAAPELFVRLGLANREVRAVAAPQMPPPVTQPGEDVAEEHP